MKKTLMASIFTLATLLTSGQIVQAATIEPSATHLCKVATTNAIYPCSIGKSGIRADKKEGDGATPAGQFSFREIFYRADKLSKDEITQVEKLKDKGFSVKALTQDDGWVDDVNSVKYNQYVQISSLEDKTTSHENLWRNDDVYDIIAVIGYNDSPVVKGKGSAIFMHVAREGFKPTVGCVAFSKPELLKVLATLTPKSKINISVKGDIVIR